MRQYKQRYFPEPHSRSETSQVLNHHTFPHVILLVATWDSITPDSHNEPAYFISAIGKSVFSLTNSGLVDLRRSNVIVVVTKSMSSWHQFDDYEGEEEKSIQWKIEAGRRSTIILDLQRKAFPKSTTWPVVFIENGGSSKMDAPYRVLPNGHSHRNLFGAICNVIGQNDLAGLQALRVLTGVEPLDGATTKTLVSEPHDTMIETPLMSPIAPSPSDRISVLVDKYLGVTYNPVNGTFGRVCVLELNQSDIRIEPFSDHRSKDFVLTKHDSDPPASRLAIDFPMRDVPGLRSHYSSSLAFKSVRSLGEFHLLHCVTAVASGPIKPA
ncbi:hypothetical protein F5887DRAFT_521725 [Amanita rubescens]|nr:hypothetical protein F5887DRAFT_521725 [Amanita rubescens]